jgi:hypothetical protein
MNLGTLARKLAWAWLDADQWGTPLVPDSYLEFWQDTRKCPTDLAEALNGSCEFGFWVRSEAAKVISMTRRMLEQPVKFEEDGA